jgi:hypothetical protein
MLLVHKRWRKRPYAFYESCRALQDLQLWYSKVCLLQFKNFEKTLLNKATPYCLAPERAGTWARTTWRSAMSASRPYVAVRAHRGRLATVGPSVVPRRSCAWYYGPQIHATRCACMRLSAPPPLAIGPSRRPQAAIGRRHSHRLCPIPRPTMRQLS